MCSSDLTEVRRNRPLHATLRVNGVSRRVTLSTVVISNQARFGGRFSSSPLASNCDGQLDVCGMLRPRSRWRLLWLCAEAYRARADRCQEIFQHRSNAIEIETEQEAVFFGDGEIIARGRHFRVDVLAGALKVAVPRGDAQQVANSAR